MVRWSGARRGIYPSNETGEALRSYRWQTHYRCREEEDCTRGVVDPLLVTGSMDAAYRCAGGDVVAAEWARQRQCRMAWILMECRCYCGGMSMSLHDRLRACRSLSHSVRG